LKELLPVVEVSEAHYTEAASAFDVEAVLKSMPAGNSLAVAVEAAETANEEEAESDEPQDALLPLLAEPEPAKAARNIWPSQRCLEWLR
jgi:hypothetical protein